jgi:serine/threonine protein kinase
VLDLRLRMVSFDQCFRSARVGQAAARPLSVSGSARVGRAAARPLSEDGGVSEDISAAQADVSPGDKIAGYRLVEQIGQGGMAVVYRAHDERLDRRVALKVLAPGLAADTAFRTRFIRESRAAAAVDHPNIIPIYDAGDAGGFLFISMRYVQGGEVRALLRDGYGLPPARAWHIVSQVASALDAAHSRGLVHRDVKPANILLDASSRTDAAKAAKPVGGPRDHVYLSDFGISKQTLASNLTSTGQFVGTLDYIAPEQVEGQGIDGRADQYSLACAAFELLSGSPPFQRPTSLALITAHLTEPPPSLRARRAGLAASVDDVLSKAMAKSPVQRYGSCEQFAADLGRALGLMPGPVSAQDATVGVAAVPPPDPRTRAAADQAYQTWPEPPAGHGGYGPYGQQQFRQPADRAVNGRQQPPYPPARRPRRLLLSAGVAILVLAVAAGATAAVLIARHKGSQSHGGASSPPASSPAAAAQAKKISNLLGTSSVTRGMLQPALGDIENNCRSLSPGQLATDVATIRTVAIQRQREYTQAFGLQVAALANGRLLKKDLLYALEASLRADDDYLRWARQEQLGCFPVPNSRAFSAAAGWDNKAVTAKTNFANEWNPVARQYSLPAVMQAGI